MAETKQIFYILVFYLTIQLPTAAIWQSALPEKIKVPLAIAAMGLLSILVAENYRRKLALSLADIGLRPPSLAEAWKGAALAVGAATAGLAFFALYFALFRAAFPAAYAKLLNKDTTGLLMSLIGNGDRSFWGIAGLAASLLLLAAAEEFLFRGVIYNYLLRSVSWQKAMLWSSGLFAAIHLNLTGIPIYFLSGIFYCWIYRRSNSLPAAVLGHFIYNFSLVMLGEHLVAGV